MHELPLVFFTVFSQTAVGMFCCILISAYCGQINNAVAQRARIGALVILCIGIFIGSLHLGQPIRALNMLNGIGRSPMSNEAFLSGAFVGLAFASVLAQRFAAKFAPFLHPVAVIAGLLFAGSVPLVYQLPTVPTWSSAYTSWHMWLTVPVAGGITAALFGARRIGTLVCLFGVVMTLVLKMGYTGFMTLQVPELAKEQQTLWSIQLLALLLGALISTLALINRNRFSGQQALGFLATGTVCVLVGELAARIAFYNLWSIAL